MRNLRGSMFKSQWIEEKLIENGLDLSRVRNLFNVFKIETGSNCTKESFDKKVWKISSSLKKEDQDPILMNVRLVKEKQKLIDINRFKDKSFRDYIRLENSVVEYNKEIVEILKKYDFSKVVIKHETNNSKAGGVVQISDTHFNELVSIAGNNYDFDVAAKRLKKLAIQIKKYFIPNGIKSILLAFTGDLLNSNRRIDEFLNQATNRAKASILSFFLLEQFILDLNKDFNIAIASVTGNESRIEKEPGFSDIVATDNFDFVIDNILRIVFRNCPGIQFVDGDPREKIVRIAGHNVLILHGESISKNNQLSIQQIAGGYAFKGVLIDYVLYGHFHSAHISDFFSRSSSLVGSNAYNERELGVIGRASQNIYIFYDNKSHDAIKIDLQNTSNIEGYHVEKELEAYNAKSLSKIKNYRAVAEILV